MSSFTDNAWLLQLADLTASRELTEFLTRAHALLSSIVPHRTAVAWCGMTIVVLGEEAEYWRERSRTAVLAHFARTDAGRAFPERMLDYYADSLLTEGALLAALRDPQPDCTRMLPLKRLRYAKEDADKDQRPFLQPEAWDCALLVPLQSNDDELHAGLAFYHTSDEGPFEAAQTARIEAIRPILTSLLARLLDHRQQSSTQADVLNFLTEFPVGLMLFDGQWRSLFINEEAYRQTQLWLQSPAAMRRIENARANFRLPAEVRAAGERLRQHWLAEALGFTPAEGALHETVSHPQHKDMKAIVTILQPQDGGMARPPGVLVRYTGMAARAEAAFQPSAVQLSILSQLTPGERNVALLVRRGMSNQEIADALHRDITTVKDHLSHVYDKLGIRGRTQLAAMLAG